MTRHLSVEGDVAQTVQAGLAFLARHQVAGRWRAFQLLPGISDEWVSAFIGATLLEARVPDGAPLAYAAASALVNAQRADGRFGFNEHAIGDGDSTIWALRLASSVPGAMTPSRLSAALTALATHVRPSGAVATYAAEEPIRTIIEAPPQLSLRGWCAGHPCVTAAAAAVQATRPKAIGYLLRNQSLDGGWPSYWWQEREYTVALATEAIATYSDGSGSGAAAGSAVRAVARAGAWSARRLRTGSIATARAPHGSPFATALALRACLAAGAPRARLTGAVDWLCRQVRPDGSWLPSAVLRVPNPDDLTPDRPGGTRWHVGGRREGAVVVDTSAVFTTATVISALTRCLA